MELFTYKGISAGKYVEGDIEALNQDEASHKLKERKVIITNLARSKKKKRRRKEKSQGQGRWTFFTFFWKKEAKDRRYTYLFKAICNNGKSRFTNFRSSWNVKRPT